VYRQEPKLTERAFRFELREPLGPRKETRAGRELKAKAEKHSKQQFKVVGGWLWGAPHKFHRPPAPKKALPLVSLRLRFFLFPSSLFRFHNNSEHRRCFPQLRIHSTRSNQRLFSEKLFPPRVLASSLLLFIKPARIKVVQSTENCEQQN
jgi:hypothetical protein